MILQIIKIWRNVTHQLFGTSSSITPTRSSKNRVFICPQKREKTRTLSFTLYNGKKDKKFLINQNFPPANININLYCKRDHVCRSKEFKKGVKPTLNKNKIEKK